MNTSAIGGDPSQPTSALNISVPSAARTDLWQDLGFQAIPGTASAKIPSDVLLFATVTGVTEQRDPRVKLPGPPTLIFKRDGHSLIAYRIAPGCEPVADAALPSACRLWKPGELIELPSPAQVTCRATSLQELPELTPASGLVIQSAPPERATTLTAFSLRGKASEFEANVVAAEPLLGQVCYSGQATVWYAPPNAGKTLIGLSLLGEAVQAKRVQPSNVFYINADDSSAGFAAKMRLMDDLGVHTLAPGHRGFECMKLSEHLQRSVKEGTAKGIFLIVDTLKKFVDLMNKGQASIFADACRLFVMNGGTILAFAHTNKNTTASGKLTYTGTADIVQDFDTAYILTPLDTKESGDDRVIRFSAIKRRGNGIENTAYRYTAQENVSYEERLVSVVEACPDWLDDFDREEMERADTDIIAAVRAVIGKNVNKKMALVRTVAGRIQVSQRQVIKVLEAYTGDDPERHHWSFNIKERGAKVFELLTRDEPENAFTEPAPECPH